jgi:hypothetical protein
MCEPISSKEKENPFLAYPTKTKENMWVWDNGITYYPFDEIKRFISDLYPHALFEPIEFDFNTLHFKLENGQEIPYNGQDMHGMTPNNTIYLIKDTMYFAKIYSTSEDWDAPLVPKPGAQSIPQNEKAGIGFLRSEDDHYLHWPHLEYCDADEVIKEIQKNYPNFKIRAIPHNSNVTSGGQLNRVTLWKSKDNIVMVSPTAPWVDDEACKKSFPFTE